MAKKKKSLAEKNQGFSNGGNGDGIGTPKVEGGARGNGETGESGATTSTTTSPVPHDGAAYFSTAGTSNVAANGAKKEHGDAVKAINTELKKQDSSNLKVGEIVDRVIGPAGRADYGGRVIASLAANPDLMCSDEHLRRCWHYFRLMHDHGGALSERFPELRFGHYYQIARLLQLETEFTPKDVTTAIHAMAQKAMADGKGGKPMPADELARAVTTPTALQPTDQPSAPVSASAIVPASSLSGLDPAMAQALTSALHGFAGAAERWQALHETGASDQELQCMIVRELGIRGGGNGFEFKGGNNPSITVATGQTLKGKSLLHAVRNLLGIPLTSEPQRDLNVLDLFCGAGGLSLGFHIPGYRIVAACDIWPPAIATYTKNFPEVKFIAGSLADPLIKQQIVEAFAGITCDVICGGPPCQAYSLAGKRDPTDQKAHLFVHYVDLVSRLKPKIFLMENVAGALSMKLTDGKLVVDHIQKDFHEIGYNVTYRLVDAASYGAAQNRSRVIFLGSADGTPLVFPAPTYGEAGGSL